MSETIVFISNQRIKPGKLDAYKQYYRQVAEFTEANKPGTVAHLAYINDAGTEASIVHIFPNATAMERHMQGIGEIARPALEFIDIFSFEIFGRPSAAILEAMQKAAGSAITLSIKPHSIGGYMRLKAG